MGRVWRTRSDLWQDRVYSRVWSSHAISQIGSSISLFALPLLASQTLGASNLQVSLLQATQTIPLLVLGLLIGVWVDRAARLPLMVGADLVRMMLLVIIPLAWWQDHLSYRLILVILLLVGSCSVLFDVASQSLVNSILRRDQLIIGNARIHSTYAVADIVGPAGAGLLLRLVSIPLAFAIDALSFGLSALALIGARGRERRQHPAINDRSRSRRSLRGRPG